MRRRVMDEMLNPAAEASSSWPTKTPSESRLHKLVVAEMLTTPPEVPWLVEPLLVRGRDENSSAERPDDRSAGRALDRLVASGHLTRYKDVYALPKTTASVGPAEAQDEVAVTE
jgi:hypothetical protein